MSQSASADLRALPLFLRLRHAAAWPIYLVGLFLDYTAAAFGRLAALVAGDTWPR
ncbi:hypothetical protein [Bradyrhizobium sp.]|uniref:hypothetical protein n=1 Tax=Bradyrhizobium sp. TaxID=376 RepID=UPI003C5D1807